MPPKVSPQFEIGQSVLYQEDVFGQPLSNKIYSAVVVDVFNYGVIHGSTYGSYYIRFDGDIVPESGYMGLSHIIASHKELTLHIRSDNYGKNNAAWFSQIEAFDTARAVEKAKEAAAYIAEMTVKYAHVVPGLLVKWKVQHTYYTCYKIRDYEGTVISMSPSFHCLVHGSDGKNYTVKADDLL